ncbi:endodeoxyribonuclease [Friedmanniomyces endolithicus]|uniref:DNA topoisomerase (ATP-hydrolyzing) n=1 Tax=Friedmanniomyces endolithicus TaxID=329885 RepID=A0AAN6KD43_9PEZI|nr:endodeoxyribonuclease [Friedmanniomyces endolithicus]KAK0297860.1 endodeoxyribonuclease [Friedmanniomyces endolithicus]KAK0305691.1 endodeoxyribonuclease [Friedmanniomyces endolithicus]KAK0971276.1 endodeoxyribonuclease [Friedmanniomyces endolithicus]KAK0975404.1 endodeoxyribonuclease [Friedmanniomyces endolithicus]
MDDDFEDLLGGRDEIGQDSSQESLTTAAAGLDFRERGEGLLDDGQTTPQSTFDYGDPVGLVVETDMSVVETGPSGKGKRRNPRSIKTTPGSAIDRAGQEIASDYSDTTPSTTSPVSTLGKIEAVFEQIADDMLGHARQISISLDVRPRIPPTRSGAVADAITLDRKTRRLGFPGKTAEEAWRFTVVLRILELMHEALRTGVTISKRDMYYRDPALFGSQTHVDRYVDDIAYTFNVPRSALNVTAAAKGLVVGAFSFCRRDGSILNAAADREGILIPSLKDVLSVDLSAVKWIVVVEKEASFRSIAASTFWDRLSPEGVLITGKGYPDIATRALLRYLCTPSPQNNFASPPSYALMDYDPDGLAIMSVYRYGSAALAHESAALCVPQLKWLGLRSEHMLLGEEGGTHARQGLLALTPRDRNKARKMLEREVGGDGGEHGGSDEGEMQRALRTMLMLNVKAELQLLDAVPGRMTELLERELCGSQG